MLAKKSDALDITETTSPPYFITWKPIQEVKDYYFQKCLVSLRLEENITTKMQCQYTPYRSSGLMAKPKEI